MKTNSTSQLHPLVHLLADPLKAQVSIVVEPVGNHGRFSARFDGRVLVASSRQPFLDAARVLLAEGRDPSIILTMRHAGNPTECLRARLGVAAGLTVREEDGRPPRFARWRPLHLGDGSARTAVRPRSECTCNSALCTKGSKAVRNTTTRPSGQSDKRAAGCVSRRP
jgi:hypothetical protein